MSSISNFFSDYEDNIQRYVRDKNTNEIVIIPNIVYTKEQREEFRNTYKCIDEYCDEEIYLSSKTQEKYKHQRRAHYRHKNADAVDRVNTSSESLQHELAKELVYSFLHDYLQENHEDVPVEKEKSLRNPNRIPDVFLDYEKSRFAFEIEYKTTEKNYIKKKNIDLSKHYAFTQWIIGHTKGKYENSRTQLDVIDVNCMEVLDEQNYLVFINPFTEEVCTALYKNGKAMSGNFEHNSSVLKNSFIEDIHDCLFSYYTGILTTPLQERLGVCSKEQLFELDEQWENSPLFDKWSQDFPPYINLIHDGAENINCLPIQWQYRIYHDLIKGREPGDTFTSSDVDKALRKENIRSTKDRNPFLGYIKFLNFLEAKGVIYRQEKKI